MPHAYKVVIVGLALAMVGPVAGCAGGTPGTATSPGPSTAASPGPSTTSSGEPSQPAVTQKLGAIDSCDDFLKAATKTLIDSKSVTVDDDPPRFCQFYDQIDDATGLSARLYLNAEQSSLIGPATDVYHFGPETTVEASPPDGWSLMATTPEQDDDSADTTVKLIFGGDSIEGILECTLIASLSVDEEDPAPEPPAPDLDALLTFCGTVREALLTT